MDVSTVIIKRVVIYSFKNIHNLAFDLHDGENLVIEGRNGLGKSNILNSIYWCLTGYDLSGCSDNEAFVTYGHEEEGIVDVEVTTNVGKFERICKRDAKGTLTSSLVIDGVPADTLKDGEIEIDKRLGILPFTFSNFINKDFNLRSFLLNPSYHFGLTPKTIRDVLAKQVSQTLTKEVAFNQLFLDLMKENEIEFTANTVYETIERLTAKLEADKKYLKTQKELYTTVSGYLATVKSGVDEKVKDDLQFQIKETTDAIGKIEDKLMILDSGRQSLNAALEDAQKGLLKVKFQTTTAKGVKKNDYKIESTGIDLKQVSTSESVMDSFELVENWKLAVGCSVSLPIFVDRAESMNIEKIKDLSLFHQVLYTKVTSGRRIKINNEEVQ